MLHKISVPNHKVPLPLIIKDELGEEVYNQMQEVCNRTAESERKIVIYTNEANLEILNNALNKAVETFVKKNYICKK